MAVNCERHLERVKPMKTIRYLAAVPLLAFAGLAAASVPSFAASTVTISGASVNGTTVTMNGSINDMGVATNYLFEYGRTTPTTPAGITQGLIASGGDQSVSATVSGLTPGVSYTFVLMADSGTVTSTPGAFTTGAATPPPVTNTVAGCTDALVRYVRLHGFTPATVTATYASGFIACEGLTTLQLEEAANEAVIILTPTMTPTPTPTPTVTVTTPGPTSTSTVTTPVTVPVTVPVAVPVAVGIPVGAPGTGGGTGPETGIIAMAVTGGLSLAGGSVLLARRLRRKP